MIRECDSVTERVWDFHSCQGDSLGVVRIVCFRNGLACLCWERGRVGGVALGVDVT